MSIVPYSFFDKTRKEPFLTIVLIHAILAFTIDGVLALSGKPSGLIFVILFDVPIIIIMVLAIQGRKWAYITGLVYMLIRSFNYYFDDLSFYTKNGFSWEIVIGSYGFNLIALALFVGYAHDYIKRGEW